MSTKIKQLRKLTRITEARRRIIELELAGLMVEEAELKSLLSQMGLQLSARANEMGSGWDAARLANADTRWQTWVEQRRVNINTELAQNYLRRDVVVGRLTRAVGQDVSINRLTNQAITRFNKRTDKDG